MDLNLYPIGDSYLLVAVLTLALLAMLGLVRAGRNAVGWRRWALVGLRAGVILLVLLLMLRPTLVYTERSQQAATLVVMADRSRSMSVGDMLRGRSRFDVLRATLDDARDELRQVQDTFELRAYAFDRATERLAVDNGSIPLPEKPEGEQTALGAALEEVLREEAGKRLLGVLLLSDGAQRAYPPRDIPPQTAAAGLRRLGFPLYTFTFGQSRGLGQAQDVAVTRLSAPANVFVKNQMAVRGEVRADGYANRTIEVRLLFETAPDEMEVVAQRELRITESGQRVPVEFEYAPPSPGEYKLTLEVAEQSGELVTTNNRRSTFVNVLAGGLTVLYLEGSLRVEQKFIRRALDASPDIQVDYVRIDPRDPATKPGNFAELLQPGKYQVYILGDLDSTAFTQPELRLLAQTVQRGAGLIMLGGLHSFGPGGYATTPLAGVLPVEMDRFERQPLGEPVREDAHVPGPLRMRPTRLGVRHFAMMLAADREANLRRWAELPPLDGANRFTRTRLAPGAVELAAGYPGRAGADDGHPLLVAHNFGAGRVMAFAADSTWRWWMRGHEDAFKRFWRQVILWLAKKDQAGEGDVWVRLEKRRFAPSERVELTVGANDPTGEPIADARFTARLIPPEGPPRPVELVREGAERIGSLRDLQQPGDYAIEIRAQQDGELLGNARARFLVFEQDLELDNPGADAAVMQSLAAMTAGESLAPELLPELIERLLKSTDELIVERQTKRSLWDGWPLLLAIVALLGVEWWLRKRWGLV